MTDKPAANDPLKRKVGVGGAAAVVAMLAGMLVTALLPSEARILHVYRDSAGIPTVCMGLIDPVLIARHPGVDWTVPECEVEEKKYVGTMLTQMARCIPQGILAQLTFGEVLWHAHFAFNTGVGSFCGRAKAVHKALLKGDRVGACKAMGLYRFQSVANTPRNRARSGLHAISADGSLIRQDCRDPKNKCRGLAIRRDMEVEKCLSYLTD
jgi:GH24 family phage-related lysozyme (muramidase)